MKQETRQKLKDIVHWALLLIVIFMSWLLAQRGAWMTDIDNKMLDRYTGTQAEQNWASAGRYLEEIFEKNPNVVRPAENQWPRPVGK